MQCLRAGIPIATHQYSHLAPLWNKPPKVSKVSFLWNVSFCRCWWPTSHIKGLNCCGKGILQLVTVQLCQRAPGTRIHGRNFKDKSWVQHARGFSQPSLVQENRLDLSHLCWGFHFEESSWLELGQQWTAVLLLHLLSERQNIMQPCSGSP